MSSIRSGPIVRAHGSALVLISLALANFLSGCALALRSIDPPPTPRATAAPVRAPVVYSVGFDVEGMALPGPPEPYEMSRRTRIVGGIRASLALAGLAPAEESSSSSWAHVNDDPADVRSTAPSPAVGNRVAIHVTEHPGPAGASGAMYFNMLSLGLIPVRETSTLYTVTTVIDKDSSRLVSSTHAVKETLYAHLLLLPVFWLTAVLPSAEVRLNQAIKNDLFSIPASGHGAD